MKRPDGRRADEMRPVQIIKDFTMHAEGVGLDRLRQHKSDL